MSAYGQNISLYHDAKQTLCLGCVVCTDRALCGGLYIEEPMFDCTDLCGCSTDGAHHSETQFVCRGNVEDYVNRFIEVGGWDLSDISRTPPVNYPSFPFVVPLFYGSSRRFFQLSTQAVAIPLEKLFDHNTGAVKFKTRGDLAAYFGFDWNAKILITGVGRDGPIEHYWSLREVAKIPRQLAALKPDLLTVPNYSLFIDVPRWDNLYSMKRIAICWNELVKVGLPTSLHINARTDNDWKRWTDFIGERSEVLSIAYEFATGPACVERGKWHAEKLVNLANDVGRDLQIVLRGGYYYLREISEAFSEVVFIDTSSFLKTMKRRRLDWVPGSKKHWRSAFTQKMEPVDCLLLANVHAFSKMLTHELK